MDLRRVHDGIRREIVGREEAQLLLEGPPGTSKSTLLRAVAALNGTSLRFVEGNADLTLSKLVGHHSPSRVLREDYNPDNFVHGPLPLVMQEGGPLYIEELNRVPEDTLNALLTAMAERELTVSRAGTVRTEPGFWVIAAMNPFDNIGTARLSGATTDRLSARTPPSRKGSARSIAGAARPTATRGSTPSCPPSGGAEEGGWPG